MNRPLQAFVRSVYMTLLFYLVMHYIAGIDSSVAANVCIFCFVIDMLLALIGSFIVKRGWL